jgi:hypothetical protein
VLNSSFFTFHDPYNFCSFSQSNLVGCLFFSKPMNHLRLCLFPKKWFLENHFPNFPVFVCIRKVDQQKTLSGQRKTLFSQRKFGLVFRKVFSFYFERKTLSESCEKFRNVILFADYIKFDSQTFDCYIYFILNICFSISSLRIYFLY